MSQNRSSGVPKGPAAATSPARLSASGFPMWLWVAGLASLLVGTAASGMLVLEHFGAMELPGCGHGSPCAQAAASVYGRIPGVKIPTSFVGLAYFAAVLVGWLGARDGLSAAARWTARLGALISL